MRLLRAWERGLLLAISVLGSAHCVEEQRYQALAEPVRLTADATPIFVTEDDEEIFRVDLPLTLPLTAPSVSELADLTSRAQGMMLPFPRLPWVRLHDLDLSLDYALTNESDERVVAAITLNGINEFHYYAPGPENLHQWERRVALEPRQRIHGTVTEGELDEVAIDLATVVNGAPNSNLVVEPRSQSSLDVRVQPFIPRAIPGLVGVRAGLETNRAVPLALEVSVRIQDHGERAARRGEERWEIPAAQAFVPIVPDLE